MISYDGLQTQADWLLFVENTHIKLMYIYIYVVLWRETTAGYQLRQASMIWVRYRLKVRNAIKRGDTCLVM